MKQIVLLVTLMLMAVPTRAGIFKCETSAGVIYSERPCSKDAKELNIHSPKPSGAEVAGGQAQTLSPSGGRVETSGNALIDNAAAVPYLTDGGRNRYREFLAHASPRAFVICQSGRFCVSYGWNDPLAMALQSCRELPGETCEPYAVNDEVVWKK